MRWTFSNGGADRGATKSTRSAYAQSGFGLIELLIVLIVIGLLMAIVTPIYAKQRDRSKGAVLKENGHNLRAALALYLAQGLDTTYRRSDDRPAAPKKPPTRPST
jgi:prepilin-type N-terminal cleavage/methylation domain-containing protein